MNPIEKVIEEHDNIERELIELEEVLASDEVNYSNLLHSLKKVTELWNDHENKEEKLFTILAKEEVRIPVFKMGFDHRRLRGHREAILQAIAFGSEALVKEAMEKDGEYIIAALKRHMNDEEGILRMIPITMFSEEEMNKMEEIVG